VTLGTVRRAPARFSLDSVARGIKAMATEEVVSVTLSAILLSVLAGTNASRDAVHRSAGIHPASRGQSAAAVDAKDGGAQSYGSAGLDLIRRYDRCRMSLLGFEIACPAVELSEYLLARWVRKQAMAVDVCTSEGLGVAIADGIRPSRIVVHGDALCDTELRCAARLGVGRIIIDSAAQADVLAECGQQRTQGILVRTADAEAHSYQWAGETGDGISFGLPFATVDTDDAITAVFAYRRLRLDGLHSDIGAQSGAFFSYPAAIGHMVAEMARIRSDNDQVLTRLSLHAERPFSDSEIALATLAVQIDEAIDDACAAMRFPRPRVLLSAGPPAPATLQT
jgi:diaminopimelate decarboxylase